LGNKILIKNDSVSGLRQDSRLEQIKAALAQQGSINSDSVGPDIARQVDSTFHTGNLTIGFMNATFTNNSLIGTCSPS
jgi:hypothetical protein